MNLPLGLLLLISQPAAPSAISGHLSWGEGLNVNRCNAKVKGTQAKDDCDSFGNFRIENVPAGNKEVEIRVNDVVVAVRKVNVVMGESIFLGDIVLGFGGAVKGTVTVADGLRPGSVVIGAPALGKFVRPDPNGDFLITDIPAGIFEITAQIEGKPQLSRRMDVKPGVVTFGANFDLR